MRTSFGFAFMMALAGSVAIAAAQNPPAKPTPPVKPALADSGTAKPPELKSSGFIRATIHASRPEVSIDGAFGVFADVENTSSSEITLVDQETELIVQPEVTQSGTCVFRILGWFPTEPEPDKWVNNKPPPKPRTITIQPNEHYTVVWDLNKANTSDDDGCRGRSNWDLFSFTPGSYVFTVEGKVHLSKDASGAEQPYHTFTESTNLKVVVPQLYAMVAAGIGGFIAYIVMLVRPGTSNDDANKFKVAAAGRDTVVALWVIVRNAFSAVLLAAVVTVVMSRLADSRFPITVSVNDIWGAMTVGFVSYFIGYKIIDKLAKTTP